MHGKWADYRNITGERLDGAIRRKAPTLRSVTSARRSFPPICSNQSSERLAVWLPVPLCSFQRDPSTTSRGVLRFPPRPSSFPSYSSQIPAPSIALRAKGDPFSRASDRVSTTKGKLIRFTRQPCSYLVFDCQPRFAKAGSNVGYWRVPTNTTPPDPAAMQPHRKIRRGHDGGRGARGDRAFTPGYTRHLENFFGDFGDWRELGRKGRDW